MKLTEVKYNIVTKKFEKITNPKLIQTSLQTKYFFLKKEMKKSNPLENFSISISMNIFPIYKKTTFVKIHINECRYIRYRTISTVYAECRYTDMFLDIGMECFILDNHTTNQPLVLIFKNE